MKFHSTCICVIAAMTIGALSAPIVSHAAPGALNANPLTAGGQAPPSASGGSAFMVRVGSSLPQSAADALRSDLVAEGFSAAEIRPGANGSYDVILGGVTSRAQADALMNELRSSGYTPESVIGDGTAGAAAPISQSTGSTVYRVLVAEFDSEAEASQASAVLVDDGFVNVDVVQEDNKYKLMLSTFNEEAEANSLLSEVYSAGFSLASVVSRERVRSATTPAVADADLSGLSASEQQSTRDILAMADKVESGEASADEIRRLRETIQQLSENQRSIVQALEEARASSAATGTSRPSIDPARVQSLLNEARKLERDGDGAAATEKYSQVLALDPSNIEARGKLPDRGAPASTESAETGGLFDNKTLVYGGAGLLGLVIILLLWARTRKSGNAGAANATPAPGTPSFSMGDSFNSNSTITPIGMPAPNQTPAGGSALGAGSMLGGVGYASIPHDDDEAEEKPAPRKPEPAPAPTPEESDTISLGSPEDNAAAGPAATSHQESDELVSLNFGDDQTTTPPPASTGQASGSAMDADLESLLKGTFSEESSTADSGLSGNGREPRVVFEQTFDSEPAGDAPDQWRGEYDYASLTVEPLNEDGHQNALRYEKAEGAGSATYHLTYPQASGRVIAEFDIRCDNKNKFLLGVYLERDEDFKQSIHTIVHKLTPDAPASLRIQGESAPYQMGSWSHVRFEADLNSGTLDCYLNDEHVVKDLKLPVVPDYLNTLSIRDNLATTGTLYLDNIRITEA